MHGAAIVPDHEIMRPPDVAVDELPLRGMVDQVAQQQPAFRHRPVDDVGGMRGEIEGAAAGTRDRADQRVDGALQLLLLLFVEVEAEHMARIDDGMKDAQPFDRGAGFLVERVVGGAHVGELRIRPHRWHHPRRQHRVAARRIDERGIGVPEPVGDRGGAHAVVGIPDLAVRADVGHVGQRLVAEPVAADGRGGGPGMQRAVETLGEVELLLVGEILVAEHQDGVHVHAGADRLEGGAIMHLAQVDRAHFAGEAGRERRDGDGHGCGLDGERGDHPD
jgi:hypothetical protein